MRNSYAHDTAEDVDADQLVGGSVKGPAPVEVDDTWPDETDDGDPPGPDHKPPAKKPRKTAAKKRRTGK